MPVVTLGCMRFQQSWNRGGGDDVDGLEKVNEECQLNLVNILRYAIKVGVNHIETARGYGSSEMQLGYALRVLFDTGEVRREDIIVQTKGGISSSDLTPEQFKKSIYEQIELLGLDYVDLFSIHGLNRSEQLEWLFNHPMGKGRNLYGAIEELREEGKIRHVGFSSHGCADVIREAIDTDMFDYM